MIPQPDPPQRKSLFSVVSLPSLHTQQDLAILNDSYTEVNGNITKIMPAWVCSLIGKYPKIHGNYNNVISKRVLEFAETNVTSVSSLGGYLGGYINSDTVSLTRSLSPLSLFKDGLL